MEGNGLKEMKAWLQRNAERFSGYSIEEIVNLAIACGFNRQAVAQWETNKRFRDVA